MKVSLKDPEILMAISPIELAAYLRSTGWEEEHEHGSRASIWTRSNGSTESQILLPLDKSLRDYTLRISTAIAVLEDVENRSQLSIISDLGLTSADVIRIPINYNAAGDGTMSIEDGMSCLEDMRNLILASACSTIKPRAIHPTRKPDRASEYIKRVRLGQTERGSYVFTIISKVPPQITADQSGQLFPLQEEPFERKVTKTLAHALHSVRLIALRAAATGTLENFQEAIEHGVSANLCDALVSLGSKMDPSKGMPIRFSWAPTRPLHDEIPSQILLSQDLLPFIEGASQVMKTTSPDTEIETTGYVIALQREEADSVGRIQVVDLESERPRKIHIDLPQHLYTLALSAHSEGRKIKCSGDLVKEGRNFVLRNPTGFRIIEE